MKGIKKFDIVLLLFLLLWSYFTFFKGLGLFTIRLWDEGRNGVNAIEMLQNKNFLVSTYNYLPDMWNVKPPLHIWIVALFFKIFGISEVSLRLPSAIASTLIVVAIYFVGLKIFESRGIGFLGALILLSSMGFPEIHIGRTGDYDALLTMFVFGAMIFSFLYLEKRQRKHLYWSALFWLLAVMTKGVAALLMMPAVVIYALFSGKLFGIFKDKYFWISFFIILSFISAYYLGRNYFNHGYLEAVWNEELFGRFQRNIGSTGSDFWYYWKLMASFRFQKWIYMIPISILSYFLIKNKFGKKFIIYSYLSVIFYFLIISRSQTKQYWYDAQLYPFASILVSALIVAVINKLPVFARLLPVFILAYYLQRFLRTNLAYIHRPDLDKEMACVRYGYLFREEKFDKSNYIGVDNDSTCASFQFYLDKENLKRKNTNEISRGDKIISCSPDTLEIIENDFKTTEIFSWNNCRGIILD